MTARRRSVLALVLLVAGWAVASLLAPAFRSFMLNGMHSGCFWGANGPGWSCEDDPFPNLVVPFTELLLASVFVLAVVVIASRGLRYGSAHRRERTSSTVGALVVCVLPSAYVVFLVASATAQLDRTGAAALHLGNTLLLAVATVIAVVVACVATVLLVLRRGGERGVAAVGSVAWIALALIEPGLAWLAVLGVAFLASVLLSASAAPRDVVSVVGS